MNKRVFMWTTAVAFLVLCGLLCVRAGLDEVTHTSAFLRGVDSAAGWLLSILGFVLSLSVLALGGYPPGNGVLLLFVTLFASSVIWGVVVGNLVQVIRKKTPTT